VVGCYIEVRTPNSQYQWDILGISVGGVTGNEASRKQARKMKKNAEPVGLATGWEG